MNGRLTLVSFLSLVALGAAFLPSSCSSSEFATVNGAEANGDDDAGDASDGLPLVDAAGTLASSGGGNECADASLFNCIDGKSLVYASCVGGAYVCPTGYTPEPVTTPTGGTTKSGCGGQPSANANYRGQCYAYATCTAHGGLIDSDNGAIQGCPEDTYCCTTLCPAGTCVLVDGGESFAPTCLATTKTLVCPPNAALVTPDAGAAPIPDASVDAADAASDADAD